MALALTLSVQAAAAAAPGAAEPVTLEADSLTSVPDGSTRAKGSVVLLRPGLTLRAERLLYDAADGLVRAEGRVELDGASLRLQAPAAQVQLETWEGWLQQPSFELAAHGTRGSAERVDLLGRDRFRALEARYTSCPRPEPGDPPAWEIVARAVDVDLAGNEGRADGARLRFLGTTILAAPALSFPVTDARKSGWLPPSLNLDSRSGLDLSVPYYWNIAPNLDATLAPRVMTRRGAALDAELRYLQPDAAGELKLDWLPHDRARERARHALVWQHRQDFGPAWRLDLDAIRVSDDNWWRDFPRGTPSLTPRLLPLGVQLQRRFDGAGLFGQVYLRGRGWQALHDADAPFLPPYARAPQVGLTLARSAGPLSFEAVTELNRFVLSDRQPGDTRPDGWRWHGQAALSWPFRPAGGWFVPRLTLHATHYLTDQAMANGQRRAERVLPGFSLDTGLNFERRTEALFGRELQQTLEPRVYYVQRPYKAQDQLPVFDTFGKEFNLGSIYADNPFAGQDRLSDARQLTFGVTSRLLEPATGAELFRVGLAQRYLMRSQQVAPALDGSPDGPALSQSLSDLLLLGSTTVVPGWAFEAALQYSPDSARLRRSVVGATFTPAPFRTLNLRYRLARGLSEQVEAGWQWPLYGASGRPSGQGRCGGTLYGVGRMNYSLRDSRVTDSLLGIEYDAGCWIGRVVAERVSTGRSEATTRLMLQLELVGLSRLGSNPLKVLKDNIPGYRLLRDDDGSAAQATTRP